MDILMLNKKHEVISVLNSYISVLWIERYDEYSEFEIYAPVSMELLGVLEDTLYLQYLQSDKVMILEGFTIETHIEDQSTILIKGRSLESLLDYRIIWRQTSIRGSLENGIIKLLLENIIQPTNTDRKIFGFKYKRSKNPEIEKIKVDTQYTGKNLYEVVRDLCRTNNLGYRVSLDGSDYIFELYKGVDRTYQQSENPYVIFSPDFDNLLNTTYKEDNKSYRNVALIAGEEEGTKRTTTTTGKGKGLDRREMFVDARDMRSETEDGKLTDAEYKKQLRERGLSKMKEYKRVEEFEGSAEVLDMFRLRSDFDLGDLVQIENEFGISRQVRVSEIVISHDINRGYTVLPTFKTDEEDD